MLVLMRCVAEAAAAKGLRGLAEWVPGVGPYLYDIAADALKRFREGLKREALRDEVRKAAEASFAEAKDAAERVARSVAAGAPEADRVALELYLSQIPGAVRRSLRRTEDPTGKTVPASFTLDSPADLERLLPPQMPRMRPGNEVPGRTGWALAEPLGAGGFGEVWLARQRDGILRDRAVKFCTDPAAKQRLLTHEGKLVARVMREGQHPNVVTLVDADLSGTVPWLAYEYAGDGDLTGLILRWQKLSAAERVKKTEAALKTLAETAGHFHALAPPIVHRDLKPSNILVMATKENAARLMITDFGIGGIADQKVASPSRDGLTGYTKAMAMLNGAYTPLYASPQQQRGEKPDPRDDVHALGVIAYQMLTGRLDAAPGAKFERELETAGVPDRLIDLIGDCVDPDPKQRLPDGNAVAARLTTRKPRRDSDGDEERPASSPGNRFLSGIAVVLLVAYAALFAFGTWATIDEGHRIANRADVTMRADRPSILMQAAPLGSCLLAVTCLGYFRGQTAVRRILVALGFVIPFVFIMATGPQWARNPWEVLPILFLANLVAAVWFIRTRPRPERAAGW